MFSSARKAPQPPGPALQPEPPLEAHVCRNRGPGAPKGLHFNLALSFASGPGQHRFLFQSPSAHLLRFRRKGGAEGPPAARAAVNSAPQEHEGLRFGGPAHFSSGPPGTPPLASGSRKGGGAPQSPAPVRAVPPQRRAAAGLAAHRLSPLPGSGHQWRGRP
ncbi:hypothetical protein NDU88_002336 [Pleurodeles waltl]|uniref:Uncharacterized protein n=1 Tax=Pleurodeles waltl TaxID=8319 RepID=A0AAV7WQC9_PLEWA|nr:hypothetical protein NDU88_002336 [Pleurodeles waltl]